MILRHSEINSKLRQNFLWSRFDGEGMEKGVLGERTGQEQRRKQRRASLWVWLFSSLHFIQSAELILTSENKVSIIPVTQTSTCFSGVLSWGLGSGKRFFPTSPSLWRHLHSHSIPSSLCFCLTPPCGGEVRSDWLGLRNLHHLGPSCPLFLWDLNFLQEVCVLLYFSMLWVLQKHMFLTGQGLCGKSSYFWDSVLVNPLAHK